jgi:hypothetical protein
LTGRWERRTGRRAVKDDHSLELRKLGLFRLDVQRLDVQKAVLDGHDEQT